jgi:hypothetical protein
VSYASNLLIAIAGATLLSSAPTAWDFENDPPGRGARGFTEEVGTWVVQADPIAKNHVLAQVAKSDDDTFNVALIDDVRLGDFDMSVRVKAVAGQLDRGGGVVWRAKDAKNYYICRYNPLEANFRLYKLVAGVRTQFADATVKADKEWHTIRVTMVGPKMTCYHDGTPRLSATDSTFPDPGKIGLWSKADAQSLFDDLKADELVAP